MSQLTETLLKKPLKVDTDPYELYTLTDFHWRNTVSFIGEDSAREQFSKGKAATKEARAVGKTLGLAMCYNGTWVTVRKAYPNKTEAECKTMVQRFFSANKVLRKHLDNIIAFMKQNGFVKTILGRKIPVEGWDQSKNSSDWRARLEASKAENGATNYPIQGLGGEVIRLIIIATSRYIEKFNLYKWCHNNASKQYIKRIATIKPETDIEQLQDLLDEQPDGHTLIVDFDRGVQYERLIAYSPAILDAYCEVQL